MKKTPIIALLLSTATLITLFSGCSNGQSENSSTAVQTTASPATTEGHLHLDPVVYPSSIDFSDAEGVERLFDMCEVTDGVKVAVSARAQQIKMRAKINGKTFQLNVDLSGANGHTTPEQLVTCAKLFFYCYPQMYARFSTAKTPTTVTLKFEDSGYEVASASGNSVHIHDQWLKNHPEDFDCLTHEFAHVIQSGWDGDYVPSDGDDTYMIERFADYCRYLYAYRNGRYNDMNWELQTINTEDTYVKSVRFWAWVDYTYSTAEIDIMNRIQQAVNKKTYPRADWESGGKAWEAMFKDTKAAGKDLDTLWAEFAASGVGDLLSRPRREGEKSPLLSKLPLRDGIAGRYPAADDYIKP